MIFAILSLFIVITISLLVTRLAATALMLTGMSQEAARFQARSALSGVGFTTNEAELVVNHPVRRRIIMWLMLAGSIGVPAVIATAVVSVLTTVYEKHWLRATVLLAVGAGLLIFLERSRWIEAHLNQWLIWALKKWWHLDVRDYVSLLQLQNGYAVTEMIVESGDWLEGKTLQEAALTQEGILALGIQRADGAYVGAPRATDRVHAGDTLILYGHIERLRQLDERGGPPSRPAPSIP